MEQLVDIWNLLASLGGVFVVRADRPKHYHHPAATRPGDVAIVASHLTKTWSTVAETAVELMAFLEEAKELIGAKG